MLISVNISQRVSSIIHKISYSDNYVRGDYLLTRIVKSMAAMFKNATTLRGKAIVIITWNNC